jgi:hypothetical protein
MKTKTMAGFTVLVMCSLMMGGCMSKKEIKKGEAQMKQPINCATAEQDIKLLESEKARTSQEIVAGATSIIPIGAVVHLLMLDEGKQLKVGFGEYNRMIDKKIAEIKKECKIQ